MYFIFERYLLDVGLNRGMLERRFSREGGCLSSKALAGEWKFYEA